MTQDIHSHEHIITNKTSFTSPAPSRGKRSKQRPLAWLEEPYNHTRGEMSLWIAVIMQAVIDAISKAPNAEARYHKHEAIHWLTGNSKDFVMVCTCAGLDPDYVRRKAKRTLVAPVAWRAEPGKGKRYLERKSYRNVKKRPKLRPPENPDPVHESATILHFSQRSAL